MLALSLTAGVAFAQPAYVTEAPKTWRKKNACVLMATQSSEDLERSELLRVAVESCPTKIFLANPNIDRAAYQALFQLNDAEAERIGTLIPRQQLLLKWLLEGGYVVAPPSIHPNGTKYTCDEREIPVADLPQDLLELLIAEPQVAAEPLPPPLRNT